MQAAPINIMYQGNLRCDIEHTPSTTRLKTKIDEKPDRQGNNFSPTDLLAAAVGSSIISTMAIAGEKQGIDIRGAKVQVHKQMSNGCVEGLSFRIIIPKQLPVEEKNYLGQAAKKCPGYASLNPQISTLTTFEYVGA